MNENYFNRLQWFRQFTRTVSGSNNILIVGVDIAKNKHHAFLGTPDGRTILRRLIFENSLAGFETLLFHANNYLEGDLEDIVFGVEPTSVYHKPLAEFLITMGYMVVYVTNNAIKKNRALIDGRWDKNDTKDSANVADLVSRGKCHFYDLPDMNLRDIRSLLSLRKRLKNQEHRVGMRIRNNLVAQYFPELDHAWYGCRQENLSIVRRCLSPEKICKLEFDDFCRMIVGKRRGIRQYKRLRYIWEAAEDSIGCTIGPAAEFEARMLSEQLVDTRQQIVEVEETLYTICESYKEYELLKTIPGFGPFISAAVLGAIGTPQRFENAKQVLRLAGLDLNANRSGKTSRTAVPVISKMGKANLRYALYQAAKVATSRTAEFKAYFQRLLDGREREKGIGTKMRVKVSAKMLVIAWTMMKRMQPYKPGLLVIEEPVQQPVR
jgi:transposase